MIECQSIFVCHALTEIMKKNISRIQVKNSAAEDCLAEIKQKLKNKVWVTDAKDCKFISIKKEQFKNY